MWNPISPKRSARAVRRGLALVLAPMLAFPTARAAEPESADGTRLFRDRIAPVLKAECYTCHSAGATKLRGGLRLDTRQAILEGGDSGPAVVPGKAGESLLIHAIRHEDDLAMPPKKPRLPELTIADFEKWVDAGAPYSSAVEATSEAGSELQLAREHWAFRPVKKARPPMVADAAWVKNPIDAFILARLEAHRWHPAPPAERGEWLRRVTFDVTGLPPSPEEIAALEGDRSELAEERVVDRLLDGPRYGERWAQHWLDVVRYAESEGFEYDRQIPDAWRFRDYVIDSFNRDKPFDRFLIEQIAGDEVAPDDRECQVASIFHRLGPVRRNAGNPEIALSRNEVLTERTDIIGTAFLGLTIGWRDATTTSSSRSRRRTIIGSRRTSRPPRSTTSAWPRTRSGRPGSRRARRSRARSGSSRRKLRKASGTEKARLAMEIEALEDSLPPAPATIPAVWDDREHRTPIHVLKRGVWENKGELVGPRPPSVLIPDDLAELLPDASDPRIRLARWLSSPGHPLTARVIVNRVWQHHFGTGLVKTVNDFGTRGDRPSHPELLDWLAATLVENGWRLKSIHRLILLSAAYRQSSHLQGMATETSARQDPENRLLWRFNRRRLDAEEVRDAMLAASGRLNLRAGGPSVMVPVDRGIVQALYKPSQWQVARDPAEHDRRSIYLIAKRNLRLPMLEVFDAPALATSCPRREASTHAPQALELLNGRLANDLAATFAVRLRREAGNDPRAFVHRAYLLALGRSPSPREEALALEFLSEGAPREFTLALFNLNGFLYVP